jgi:hypothetical protein
MLTLTDYLFVYVRRRSRGKKGRHKKERKEKKVFFCNLILFAVCTRTFSRLCINVYNGM